MAPRFKATGLIVLAVFAVTAVASAGRTAGPPGFTLSGSIKSKVAKKQTLNFVLSIEGTGIPIFGPAMSDGWKKGSIARSRLMDRGGQGMWLSPARHGFRARPEFRSSRSSLPWKIRGY